MQQQARGQLCPTWLVLRACQPAHERAAQGNTSALRNSKAICKSAPRPIAKGTNGPKDKSKRKSLPAHTL
eukprot:5722566-Amphidinium_carterae.1